MPNAVLMLCAGRATRMRGAVADKVLAPLAGRPVLEHSVRAFLAAGVVGRYVFVTRDAAQEAAIRRLLASWPLAGASVVFTRGGAERRDSVGHGLRKVGARADFVFIHDAARPLVTPAHLRALLAAAQRDQAAVLAHRVTDTIKQVPPRQKAGLQRLRLRDLRRDQLWAMETPQVFARALITRAYDFVIKKDLSVTDDAAAAAALGQPVTLVENAAPNLKLTHPADFAWAELLLRGIAG